MKGPVSYALALIVAVHTVMVLFVHDYRDPRRHFLTWDAYGYYLYLPGAFIYGDLDAFAFTQKHREHYYLSGDFYQVRDVAGKPVPSYTMGLAILWLPFFLAAHAVALAGAAPADGLSLPYQVAIALASAFYLWAGMRCLGRWLKRYVDAWTAAMVLLTLYFGTNLFYYAVFQPGLTHIYLFALYGVLLWWTERWFDRPSLVLATGLGALLALLCVARPTEVVAVILLLGYALSSGARWRAVWSHPMHVGAAALAGLAVVFPQMLIWKRQTGRWLFNAYAEQGWGFDWLHPHFAEKIFGFEKGWLLYSPLMGLAVLGLFFVHRYARAWAWPVAVFFLVNLWVLCAYTQWGMDTGFGMRFIVQSYAVLALPLAAFFCRFLWPARVLAPLGVALSLFQIWQLRQGILPTDHVNKPFYQAVFLKTTKDRMDLRFLDLEERPVFRRQQGETLAGYTWPADSVGAMGGQVQWVQGEPAQLLPGNVDAFSRNAEKTLLADEAARLAGQWVNLKARVLTPTDLFGHYDASLLVFTLTRPGVEKPLRWVGVRYQRSIPVNTWTDFAFDVRLPADLRAGDVMTGGVWSPKCPDTVYVAGVALGGDH